MSAEYDPSGCAHRDSDNPKDLPTLADVVAREMPRWIADGIIPSPREYTINGHPLTRAIADVALECERQNQEGGDLLEVILPDYAWATPALRASYRASLLGSAATAIRTVESMDEADTMRDARSFIRGEHLRQTGRTTRMLLEAMEAAKDPARRVTVIAATPREARQMRHRYRDLGGDDSRVRFMPGPAKADQISIMIGIDPADTFIDHHYTETRRR